MQFDNFKWLFESSYEKTERGIRIYAPEKTNLFVNPSNDKVDFTIPFLYQEVEGDFVLRAKVCHDFQKVYDACVLLALDHERMWAKACFEFTDIGTHSVVTVMNNGNSDDANNEIIDGNQVWLQLAGRAMFLLSIILLTEKNLKWQGLQICRCHRQ